MFSALWITALIKTQLHNGKMGGGGSATLQPVTPSPCLNRWLTRLKFPRSFVQNNLEYYISGPEKSSLRGASWKQNRS